MFQHLRLYTFYFFLANAGFCNKKTEIRLLLNYIQLLNGASQC